MKKILTLALMATASLFASAQDSPSQPNLTYAFAAVTNTSSTGQVGRYLVLADNLGSAPANYSIDFAVTGTAPTACTFRVEGSSDGVHWTGLDATSPAANSCVASNLESITYKPVVFLRINLVSWTPGDSTSQVIFHFTGARK